MYMYMCVYIYIHIHVHVHTHIHRCIETNIHRHTHIHVHIHVHIHRYIETVGVSKQRLLDRLPQDESLLRRVVEDGEFALVHALPAEIGEMLLRLLCHARDRSASSDGQTTLEYDSCRSWIANAEEVCACMPCVYDSAGSWCGCVRRDGWAPRAEWFHSRTITRAGVSPACASASLRHAARLIARRVLTRSTSVLRVNALNGCSIAPNWSPKSRHRFPALLRMLCLRFLRALPLLLSLPQLNHRLPWCAHAASPGQEVQAQGTGAKSPGRLGFY